MLYLVFRWYPQPHTFSYRYLISPSSTTSVTPWPVAVYSKNNTSWSWHPLTPILNSPCYSPRRSHGFREDITPYPTKHLLVHHEERCEAIRLLVCYMSTCQVYSEATHEITSTLSCPYVTMDRPFNGLHHYPSTITRVQCDSSRCWPFHKRNSLWCSNLLFLFS